MKKNNNAPQLCVELTIHTESFGKVGYNFYNFQRFFKVPNEFVGKKTCIITQKLPQKPTSKF